MTAFCLKPVEKPAARPRNFVPDRDLCRTPGRIVDAGRAIEWTRGDHAGDLTVEEIDAIKRATGCKRVKVRRAIEIKCMMNTSTVAQIAKRLGCSERTVWGVRSALLSVRGGDK